MFDPAAYLAPLRATLAMSSAAMEGAVQMQQAWIDMATGQSGRAGEFGPDQETRMREAFHAAADANLRRWEETATMLQDMPDIYRDAMKWPGTALTDCFDAAKRGR